MLTRILIAFFLKHIYRNCMELWKLRWHVASDVPAVFPLVGYNFLHPQPLCCPFPCQIRGFEGVLAKYWFEFLSWNVRCTSLFLNYTRTLLISCSTVFIDIFIFFLHDLLMNLVPVFLAACFSF